MKKERIEIFRSRTTGQYSWRYRAKNGERIAIAGETYINKSHAAAMVTKLFGEKIASGEVELVMPKK